jgi:hypothetical protein
MVDYQLKNIDPEDIERLLVKVEASFGIKFFENELVDVRTFGQFCDHVISKIHLEDSNNCTTQQAFYKLRDAFTSVLELRKSEINTDSLLANLLPRQSRRLSVDKLEKHLKMKLGILQAPEWLTYTFVITLLMSLALLFIESQIGLFGLIVSIAGLWLSTRFGSEMKLVTVKDLLEKMTAESYLKSRRDSATVNRSEIEKILRDWFSEELALEKRVLTRDAEWV